MKLRPPFKIHGGKYYLSDFVIKSFPENYEKLTYVEPFGGAASVLLNKKLSSNEIYNDLHSPTANIFNCLVNFSEDLISKIKTIEYKEESFKSAGDVPFQFGNVDSAVAELTLRRMSRGGMKKAFSWSNRLRGGRPGDVNAWETFKSQLVLIADRVKNVKVFNENAIGVIARYIYEPNTLIYLDPPYVKSTRTSKSVYDCEMTDKDHNLMADLAYNAKCKIVISGYYSGIYKELFKDWNQTFKDMPNNSGQGKTKQRRVEVLWTNY